MVRLTTRVARPRSRLPRRVRTSREDARTPRTITSIQAAYDAASSSGLMEGAWANADLLTADEAADASIRQTLRSRSRYECLEANSFLKGAIGTVVDVIVGRGPRLQMQLPGTGPATKALNRRIEALYNRWAKAVRYAEYLRTLVKARIVDGEGFGLRTTSSTVPLGLPTLFPRNIEAERITDPRWTRDDRNIDGVLLNDAGEPIAYTVYDRLTPALIGRAQELDRADITHLFRRDRPGQHRGIPELTTSLPLCNLLRQYTLATVTAARTAAKHSVILESQANSVTTDGTAITPLTPFDSEEIDYDMLTAMPIGWRTMQMKAEQPTTTYEMFRDALLGEIVRPLGAPLNVVLGSSAKWNYASTQADRITFANKTRLERQEIEDEEVDRTFSQWWDEAVLMGLIPADIGPLEEIPHRWFWDALPDADPQTLASARQTNLQTGHASREQELHESGLDIDAHDESAAQALGLTVTQFRQVVARQIYGSNVDAVLSGGGSPVPLPLSTPQIQSLSQIIPLAAQGQISTLAGRTLAAALAPALSPEQIAAMFPDDTPAAAGSTSPPASTPTATEATP